MLITILALPNQALAAINTIYDLKLKIQQTKDAVVNSPLYGIVLYFGGTIMIFVIAIIVIFILIMLIKK